MATENNPEPPEDETAEAYASAEPVVDSGLAETDTVAGPPRLGIGLVILVVMWLVATIPGMIRPLTLIHFVSMQGAPILATLALSVWWLASRRVPMKHRLVGWVLAAGLFVGTMMTAHPSLGTILFIYGLPVSLTILVGVMWIRRSNPWPRPGWLALIVMAIFLASAQFVRIGFMDAAFAFSLVPRWTPTAEETFLAKLDQDGNGTANADVSVELPAEASQEDWAEFRGPNRDSSINNVGLATDWETNPPRELWRRPIGPGWSSFCVIGPLAITQEQRGEQEAVVAYSVEDGSIVWAHEYPGRFEASMGGIGPRATPTFRDGRLYVSGASGVVFCLDASSGERVWEYNLVDDLKVRLPEWGFSSSPLVLDEIVVVFSGGGEGKATVALTRDEGKLRWSAGDGTHSYSSPQLSTLHRKDQILVASDRGVRSFDPADGAEVWKHDWEIAPMARVTQPMVVGDTVYLGTGYGNGTQRFDVLLADGEWSTDEKWTASMKPYFNDAVYLDGFIYGFDGPIFMCLDAEDGSKAWKKGRYGHGQVLLLADQGLLLVVTEQGSLVLVKADSEGLQEISKLDAVKGVTWNHPVIANGRLLVRNSEEVVCYEVPVAESAQ